MVTIGLRSLAGQHHSAIVAGGWKGILNLRSATRELYDLSRDPTEQDPWLERPLDEPVPPAILRFLGW